MDFSLFKLAINELINEFTKGCDGSVLLNDAIDFKGEKNAFPNRNSVCGFEVIDNMKADVERACPSIVSCVDLLTLAAREAVILSGGPFWPAPLGRRDGTTASEQAANEQLLSPFESVEDITAKFTSKGLDMKDVVVLSGAHFKKWCVMQSKIKAGAMSEYTKELEMMLEMGRSYIKSKTSGSENDKGSSSPVTQDSG